MGAAATCAAELAEGVHVLAVDRVGEGLVGTHTLLADLADPDAFAAIAGAAESLLGGCDILIEMRACVRLDPSPKWPMRTGMRRWAST